MSKKRQGHKTAPKVPLSKRINGSRKRAVESPATKGYGDEKDLPPKKLVRRKGGVLNNPDDVQETASDLKLVERALRERWDVRGKGMLQRRLLDVVAKTTVPVLTKHGIFDSESDADSNAIMASRVLVQMNGQDQEDDQFELKNKNPPQPGTVVNVNLEPGQSRILQLAESLGATRVIIDGRAVPIREGIGESTEAGTIQPEAGEQVHKDAALAKARAILGT